MTRSWSLLRQLITKTSDTVPRRDTAGESASLTGRFEFGDFNIDLDEHEDIEFLWSPAANPLRSNLVVCSISKRRRGLLMMRQNSSVSWLWMVILCNAE